MAVCNIQDAQKATRLLAATTLRNVLGTRAMSEVLSERESISHEMQVQHRDNQHCDAIRLWFFICLFWICFVFWTFREFSLRWRRLCLCFLHSCRRYMAEILPIRHKTSINQSINQSIYTHDHRGFFGVHLPTATLHILHTSKPGIHQPKMHFRHEMLMFKVYSIFNSWYEPFAPKKVVYTDEKKSLILTWMKEKIMQLNAPKCSVNLSRI